jgi:peptide/nickel transport system substrate-binding protein
MEEPAIYAPVFNRPIFWPQGQFLSRQSRNLLIGLAIAAIVALIGVARWRSPSVRTSVAAGRTGGELVVSIRAEPRTFNRYAARDQTTEAIALLTQAKLIRINRVTQEPEPWLAERWTGGGDSLTYTLALRPGISWSDGQPFTADDVLFSFEAAYDEKTGSPLGDGLMIEGRRLQVRALDPQTVQITFPSRFAPGLRLLDNLPILPRHKLAAALAAGTFAKAWSVSTPPSDVVGLGPFVLTDYVPGQRVVFARNTHYWRKDEDGVALPYLDRIRLEISPEQNTEVLRLEAGEIDALLGEVSAESYAPVKRAADAGRLRLMDLGVGLDVASFWFNLKPGAFAGDPRAAWLQRDELRQAISLAVDRQAFADAVFLGAAEPVFGPITPANRKWYTADAIPASHDIAKSRALLATIGLTDRDGDGILDDSAGRPARFTLITVKGTTALEKGAAVVRDQLKPLGVIVDVVALENSAVIQRFLSGNYEAVYFPVLPTDTDPATNLDFWLSAGSAHVWNIGQQSPATEWERQIDILMAKQVAAADESERLRLFGEVQRVFGEHQPVLYFAAPRVFVATSARVRAPTPAVQRPQLLWAADTISLDGDTHSTR